MRSLLACFLVFAFWNTGQAQTLNLDSANGQVVGFKDKVLTIRTKTSRNATRNINLRTIGTSKLSTLVRRRVNGTFVLSQRELPLKSIRPNQAIAVVFTRIGNQPVLLNGVVKPLPAKSPQTKKTRKKTSAPTPQQVDS